MIYSIFDLLIKDKMIIQKEFDPIGNAIINYFHNNDNTAITVKSSAVEDDELIPSYLFRKYEEMPLLEKKALKHCSGKILDIGAGAGCHSLYLQEKNKNVTALEISTLCCNIMKEQGVKNIINSDITSFKNEKFDTLLLLMNGIGVAGTLSGLENLLIHLKSLLNKNGKILLDSSDLIYLFEEEDGSFLLDVNATQYYGEIEYLMTYKNITSLPFSWLFADSVLLTDTAEKVGLKTKILEYGLHYDYLAELTIR